LPAALLAQGRQAQLIPLLQGQEQAARGKGLELAVPGAPPPTLAKLGADSISAPARMLIDKLLQRYELSPGKNSPLGPNNRIGRHGR
jgi:hypothetical protein